MSSKDGDKAAETPAAAAEPTDEVPAEAAGAGEEEDGASSEAIQNLFQHMALKRRAAAKDTGARAHGFWDKQPVPKLAEKPDQNEPIETKTVADVRATPYKLPSGFTWSSVDVADDKQLDELYDLLAKNYVEDDDTMFRFDYKPEFLRWALTAPGYFKDWMVGVRHASTGDLCAFISGIPVHTHVRSKEMSMCEINFLCVHKELRSKRLAPKLIKEVTRRVNLRDIWQAVYTAGVVVPSPVADCRYFHRTLNARKLLEIGFTRLGPRMTQLRFERLQKLAPEPLIEGWRPMAKHDISAVAKLLNAHLSKYALHLRFSDDEVRHWLLPRDGVVSSYVVARPKTDAAAAAPAPAAAAAAAAAASSGAGADAPAAAAAGLSFTNDKGESVVGFASYYLLPSTVLRHAKHSDLKAAYSYYNVAGDGIDLTKLMECALIAARNEGMDVFNALHLMRNETFFKELKFGPGDGTLHYYLYNWKCAKMKPADVGIVLL